MVNAKKDRVSNILDYLDIILKVIMIMGGIIVWFTMPSKIPIHFNGSFEPDAYGSKALMLIAFVMPLISFIPFSVDLPDRNIIADENMYNLLVQDEYRKAKIKKLVLTAVMSIFFWGAMILVLINI